MPFKMIFMDFIFRRRSMSLHVVGCAVHSQPGCLEDLGGRLRTPCVHPDAIDGGLALF